jgi:hypothetical protein
MSVETSNEPTQAEFWRANRDQYRIEAAFRDNGRGVLMYPYPMAKANCWVIVREVQGELGDMPDRLMVGEFEDVTVAEMVCELIEGTAKR